MVEHDVLDQRGSRRVFELMRRVYSSTDTNEILEEIVNGIVDVLGFGVAAISQLDGTMLVMTNVAGPEEARQSILGRRTRALLVLDEYRQADRWGILRFVPHGRTKLEPHNPTWVPDIEPSEMPGVWHPKDALYAPLYSATGELLGNIAVDLPPGGMVPDERLREQLEFFAVQAGLALSNARQRDRLTRRLALGEALTEVARGSALGDLDELIDVTAHVVRRMLQAEQVWVRCYTDEPGAEDHVTGLPLPNRPDERISGMREELAEAARATRLIEVGRDGTGLEAMPRSGPAIARHLSAWSESNGLLAPVVVGDQVLGFIGVVIGPDHPDPSDDERQAIVEVARELGRVVHTTRLHLRERRLLAELQEVDRYKQELIATISHELKTPLTSIMGHVELMKEGAVTGKSLEAVDRNAVRLHRLTQNLLDYSRFQARRESLRRPIDLACLAGTSVELLSFQAETSGVTLELQTPDKPVRVEADADELSRVVDNLLGNAVKYTPEGGQVCVQVEAIGCEAVLRVTDDGLGISAIDQQHLFSAFHRSSNPQALSLPGTGLGLAISRRITEQHGGSIDVDSELGHGSTFTLRLPLLRCGS